MGRRGSRRSSERILGDFVKEVSRLEKLGDETGVHTLREWEEEMI